MAAATKKKSHYAEDPFQFFSLPGDATPSQINAAYKEKAWGAHPDQGGEILAWLQLSQMRRRALAIARQPRKCSHCDGEGKICTGQGFKKVWKQCQACKGLGKVVLE